MVESRGFSSGIWCFRNDGFVNLELLDSHSQCMSYDYPLVSVLWILSLLYTFPTASVREELWLYLINLSNYISVLWVLIGDFDQVLDVVDKRGRS